MIKFNRLRINKLLKIRYLKISEKKVEFTFKDGSSKTIEF
jgi:hypothetical protein